MARDRAARPQAKPLRLFVAVDVPADVRDDLAAAVAPLRETIPGRWTPPENWHVTVRFLGATWPRLLDWVVEACEGAARTHTRFETSLSGLGAFPSPRRARVLWAGFRNPSEPWTAIAASLDDALAREFRPEKRAFTPHLTVARFDPPRVVGEAIEGIDATSRPFTVDRLILYRSHLGRPAPRYEPLGEFGLGL